MTVAASLAYLSSEEAHESLEANVYWPKWDSPYWHLVLLWELGEIQRAPGPLLDRLIARLNDRLLHFFPLGANELPAGKNVYRDVACHCQLGTVYQVLAAAGRDVDRELPWVRPWFLKYELPGGGLTCDESVYARVARGELPDSLPTSIVATLPVLESLLLAAPGGLSDAETALVDRGAALLIGRELRRGSHADECEDEADWRQLCFPRFYFYDVLRGLSWLLRWAETREKPLPRAAFTVVWQDLSVRFPDGQMRLGRACTDGTATLRRKREGDLSPHPESTGIDARGDEWIRRQPASRFPLLDAVGPVGALIPRLTREWVEAGDRLARLEKRGLIS